MFLFISLLIGCTKSVSSCDDMCREAKALTASCLLEWDLDWDAAGYEDADAFENSCETWIWEQEQLIEAAQKRGDAVKSLEETCSNRAQILSSDTATCEDMGLWSEEL